MKHAVLWLITLLVASILVVMVLSAPVDSPDLSPKGLSGIRSRFERYR
ncbi:MAG: hypothetical protein GF408_03035 [Candidatus Omnitrophica bacterium]|nr:hypothetical protein [Candidatus Omnitrophota bacterium]